MSTELSIIRKENVELIVSSAPQAYNENQVSHDRCVEVGKVLLATIQSQGMSDDLDQQVASFLEKARKTVRKMNEKRSPVTKLFDEIRNQFTRIESEVDPTKKDTIPYQLQQLRNAYAVKRREEEERKRTELLRKQMIGQARTKYLADVDDAYHAHFNFILNNSINQLTALNNAVSLDNYDRLAEQIRTFSVVMPETFPHITHMSVIMPTCIDLTELRLLADETLSGLLPKLREQYRFDIESNRDSLIDMLPSKKKELEKLAKANAEEKERIASEMKAREEENARKAEEERRRKAEEERRQIELKRKNEEIGSLFDTSKVQSYTPKTQVQKKLVPLGPEAFMPIMSMWWTQEGCNMNIEELSKIFKKQLTFCEKLANKSSDAVFISSEHICYEDEVKAK